MDPTTIQTPTTEKWIVWIVPPRRNKYADMEPGTRFGPFDLDTARSVLSERTQRNGLAGCILSSSEAE